MPLVNTKSELENYAEHALMVYHGGDKNFSVEKWETIQLTAIVLDMAAHWTPWGSPKACCVRTVSGKLFVAIFCLRLSSLLNTVDDGQKGRCPIREQLSVLSDCLIIWGMSTCRFFNKFQASIIWKFVSGWTNLLETSRINGGRV